MPLRIKHTETTETFRLLNSQLPLYLTDEFQVWHYAVLDERTVLVISSNSCQVQTFDETFNTKYAVDFDELVPCPAEDFHAVYHRVRDRIVQADRQLYGISPTGHRRLQPDFGSEITAQAS
ncbi:MAG: hypothetical protein MUD08_15945 [Cytophagales bacterium]|jgi:6-phosphogluconolactonase/glucosamine-6-phosphate isomerase/deaminase|nr:hypothetical protein [Cytophagales bacterium]